MRPSAALFLGLVTTLVGWVGWTLFDALTDDLASSPPQVVAPLAPLEAEPLPESAPRPEPAASTAGLTRHRRVIAGTLEGGDSFYTAAARAGLDEGAVVQVAAVFAPQLNLARLGANDAFIVVGEVYHHRGEPVGGWRVVAVELESAGRRHQAIHYRDPEGRTGYYTPQGNGIQPGLLRAPLPYTRISSPFQLARLHPVLRVVRPHRGVDFAAPTGTPVSAAGDGLVTFVGRRGGYGRLVELDHGGGYTTRYSHLSSYGPGMRKGATVGRGQIIGYVGSSGLATGPHLHYEIRVDGVPRDPLTVTLPPSSGVANPHRGDFAAHAAPLLTLLHRHRVLLAAR